MPDEKIIEHIRISLEAVLSREIREITPDTRLFEDLALDSTSILELLMSLEDTADLVVDPDELDSEVFRSVGSLAEYMATQFQKHDEPAGAAAGATVAG